MAVAGRMDAHPAGIIARWGRPLGYPSLPDDLCCVASHRCGVCLGLVAGNAQRLADKDPPDGSSFPVGFHTMVCQPVLSSGGTTAIRCDGRGHFGAMGCYSWHWLVARQTQ